MVDSVPFHGKDALVYVSGIEIYGANSWSLNINTDNIETPQFGDGWKKRVTGMRDWAGNITAWMHADSKVITNAATAGVSVALLLYPDKNDLTNYMYGDAIFGASMAGGTSAAFSRDGDFVGDDTLTIVGFS